MTRTKISFPKVVATSLVLAMLFVFAFGIGTTSVLADPMDHGPGNGMMDHDEQEGPRMFRDEEGIHLEYDGLEVLFMDGMPHLMFQTDKGGIMLMFTELRELAIASDGSESIISSINLETLVFKNTDPVLLYGLGGANDSTFEMTLYTNFTFKNTLVSLEIPVSYSTTDRVGGHENMTYSVPANSVKFGLIVKGWTFESQNNTLELRFRIHESTGMRNNMMDSENGELRMIHHDDKNETGSRPVEMIQTQSSLMNASIGFETFALADGETVPVNITVDESSIFGMIGIRFPAFNSSLEYDPYVSIELLQESEGGAAFNGFPTMFYFVGFFLLAISVLLLSRALYNKKQTRAI